MYDLEKVDQTVITIDEETLLEDIDVRYSLTIPFLDRGEGLSVGIVLMNPSKANMKISDSTVNKLIKLFYEYQVNNCQIKDLTIFNVLPIYASNSKLSIKKIRNLHLANALDEVQKRNETKMKLKMKNKSIIVLAWGKPEVKTIPNLLYYKEVLSIVNLVSTLHKDNLYVLDIENAKSTFTEHGDPRHAGRSVTLKGLKKIKASDLFGL